MIAVIMDSRRPGAQPLRLLLLLLLTAGVVDDLTPPAGLSTAGRLLDKSKVISRETRWTAENMEYD